MDYRVVDVLTVGTAHEPTTKRKVHASLAVATMTFFYVGSGKIDLAVNFTGGQFCEVAKSQFWN
jgi:hypothetical protein